MSTHAHTHLEARALVVRRAESLREATLGAEMTVWEAVMACMIVSVFGFFFFSLREERGIACVRGSGRPVVQGAEMNDHNDLTTWLVRVAADPEAGQGQPGLRRD